MMTEPTSEVMKVAIVGHVDHGKSTVIGRLLADTDSLPKGKLEQVKMNCERHSRPFEYAFLIDALKEEQEQGITIDSARVFFKSRRRKYLVLDNPGHVEFVKNMVTGASRAEAAILIIDAEEGIQENSRRHGYLLSLLGVTQMAVVINKMDLVDYSETRFKILCQEFSHYLKQFGIEIANFVPASARRGDSIVSLSSSMPWYQGGTVLQVLDEFFRVPPAYEHPLRFPIQGVYKFTNFGDHRRILAGTIASGKLAVHDEVIILPSGKRTRINSIESFNTVKKQNAQAGQAIGITLEKQLYVKKGEVICKVSEPTPSVTNHFHAKIFWLGRKPLQRQKDYLLKMGATKVVGQIEEFIRVADSSDLDFIEGATQLQANQVGECKIRTKEAIVADWKVGITETSRFVIVDDFEIAGGGTITDDIHRVDSWIQKSVLKRNYRWETSAIDPLERNFRYSQKPIMVLISGPKDSGKKPLAKALERKLFRLGKLVYFLGIGNLVHGVDADLENQLESRQEHIRRLGEVANLMLDAGVLLIATAIDIKEDEWDILQATVGNEKIACFYTSLENQSGKMESVTIEETNLDKQVAKVMEKIQNRLES